MKVNLKVKIDPHFTKLIEDTKRGLESIQLRLSLGDFYEVVSE